MAHAVSFIAALALCTTCLCYIQYAKSILHTTYGCVVPTEAWYSFYVWIHGAGLIIQIAVHPVYLGNEQVLILG